MVSDINAQAVIDAMNNSTFPVVVSSAEETLIADTICKLKHEGIWSKLLSLYCFKLRERAWAKIDWRTPFTHNLVDISFPTPIINPVQFNALIGFTIFPQSSNLLAAPMFGGIIPTPLDYLGGFASTLMWGCISTGGAGTTGILGASSSTVFTPSPQFQAFGNEMWLLPYNTNLAIESQVWDGAPNASVAINPNYTAHQANGYDLIPTTVLVYRNGGNQQSIHNGVNNSAIVADTIVLGDIGIPPIDGDSRTYTQLFWGNQLSPAEHTGLFNILNTFNQNIANPTSYVSTCTPVAIESTDCVLDSMDLSCCMNLAVGGIKHVFLMDINRIGKITKNSSGAITNIASSDGNPLIWKRYLTDINSSSFNQSNNNTSQGVWYNFTFSARFIKISNANQNSLKKLLHHQPAILIIDKNDTPFFAGLYKGLKLTAFEMETGANKSDYNGHRITLSNACRCSVLYATPAFIEVIETTSCEFVEIDPPVGGLCAQPVDFYDTSFVEELC